MALVACAEQQRHGGFRRGGEQRLPRLGDGIELRAIATLELVVEPVPSVVVSCSTGVLASVVRNLVRNAIEYTRSEPPRRIAVRALERGAKIRVEISDTGPGIAPAMIPRLFEPYFRATHNHAGLGLGLSTVRRLVERHGGAVGVHSVQGEGSTFWFELPCAGGPV